MTNYLIRRTVQMIFVVFLSTIAIYALLNLVPGGPLSGINMSADPKNRFSDEDILRMEAALGLNKPRWLAYLNWVFGETWLDEVGNAIGNPELNGGKPLIITGTWSDYQTPVCQDAGGTNEGADPDRRMPCGRGIIVMDFGTSWKLARGQEVRGIIGDRIQNTMRLLTAVSVISLVIATPIGIISAVKQYSVIDYIVTSFSFFGIAMPAFWFGLMLIIVFALKCSDWGFPCMPVSDVTTTRVLPGTMVDILGITPGSFMDKTIHLILPTSMLCLLSLAGWSRFMRSSMLEVLRQDYVRTARAKGLHERNVILKHATRNALIPLVTIVVFEIPGIFGGAIITETIFNYPGMGRLFISALSASDWPIVMAYLFISAILVVIATLVGDILYTIVDPRIRFE